MNEEDIKKSSYNSSIETQGQRFIEKSITQEHTQYSLSTKFDRITSIPEDENYSFRRLSKASNSNALSQQTLSEILKQEQSFEPPFSFRKSSVSTNYTTKTVLIGSLNQLARYNELQKRLGERSLQEGIHNLNCLDEEQKEIPQKYLSYESQPEMPLNEQQPRVSDGSKNNRKEVRVYPVINNHVMGQRRAEDRQNTTNSHQVSVANRQNQPSGQQSVAIGTINNEQSSTQMIQINQGNVRILSESEIKLYLRRNIGFFGALALSSLAYWLSITKETPFQIIFAVIYCYLIYLLIENTFGTRHTAQLESWKKKDDLFTALDTIFGILGLIFVQLKLSDIIPTTVQSCLPFLATIIFYILKSNAPASLKKQIVFWKCFCILQILLISLKIDKRLDWDWKFIFLISWVLLAIIFVNWAACGLYLAVLCLLRIFHEEDEPNLMNQILGFTWYFFYYGLCIVAFVFIFGLSDAYGSDADYSLLSTILWISIIMNCFLAISTLALFKHLVIFVKDYSLKGGFFGNSGELTEQLKKQSCQIQVEKKQNYFVRLSSTYFLPLNNLILSKNKGNLLALRKRMAAFRFLKTKNHPVNIPEKEKQPISIQILKQYKQDLAENMNKILDNKFSRRRETNHPEFSRKISAILPESAAKAQGKEKFAEQIIIEPESINLSADDIENVKKFDADLLKDKKQKDENLCYICFERAPNAILMNCGHGGICYECALALTKKRPECMECRSSVAAIHKLDLDANCANIIKSFEVSKFI